MPNLQNICIKITPNRGRDVAPWIVGLNQEQRNYDIFCHLHTKESNHFEFGKRWKDYLIQNLISKESFFEIFNIFLQNPKIGHISPASFSELKSFMTNLNINIFGVDNEYLLISDLLKKMGISNEINKANMFFSMGTMMWYRPKALQPLFDVGITYQDFPEEPIGVGGTIAHAIERLPAFVCQENGYLAKFYNKDTV